MTAWRRITNFQLLSRKECGRALSAPATRCWRGPGAVAWRIGRRQGALAIAAVCIATITNNESLDLILHSPGGSLEATEQIVNYMRAKFKHIRAIIPQTAMSAATMLACACDEIVMGKQSAIGPIDPQVTIPHGALSVTVSAQAILDEFQQAKKDVMQDPKLAAIWAPKVKMLPQGILARCTTLQRLAEQKVETWLKDYMKLEPQAAKDAAKWLADANEHKTHGRPISAELAAKHGLKIVPLEDNQALQDLVLSVFHATMVTFEHTECVKLFENHIGRGIYMSLRKASSKEPASNS